MTTKDSSTSPKHKTDEKVVGDHETGSADEEETLSGDASDNGEPESVPTWPVQCTISLDLLTILNAICDFYGVKRAEMIRRWIIEGCKEESKIVQRMRKLTTRQGGTP